jgi:hypothetical protein
MATKECPYAKSDMTPCYLKDGELAVGTAGSGAGERPICVGCEHWTEFLRVFVAQRPKPHQAGPPT